MSQIEREACQALVRVLDAEDRALGHGDMEAYRALVEREARLMDIIKVRWREDA